MEWSKVGRKCPALHTCELQQEQDLVGTQHLQLFHPLDLAAWYPFSDSRKAEAGILHRNKLRSSYDLLKIKDWWGGKKRMKTWLQRVYKKLIYNSVFVETLLVCLVAETKLETCKVCKYHLQFCKYLWRLSETVPVDVLWKAQGIVTMGGSVVAGHMLHIIVCWVRGPHGLPWLPEQAVGGPHWNQAAPGPEGLPMHLL